MDWKQLPEDHPMRIAAEAAIVANEKLDKATDKLTFEYNQVLFRQRSELNNIARDEADENIAIMVRTKMEIKVMNAVIRLDRYLHPIILRQLAAALLHKADGCEQMMAEVEAACQHVNDEVRSKGGNHE